ncbi:FecR domain-containing protein [Bradyrhizobium liaoningense]|uniref:FecR family protein n=1 Tax=Bradyrhizobium liaoningense TaxID=43992 RepID=UPI001BAC5FA7|nr:FecR domain-containing protein [Bradyrhizobium liaoningense]MBR0718778.1 FecR domain-containing protein [Bradyrhizobium liaoningense]
MLAWRRCAIALPLLALPLLTPVMAGASDARASGRMELAQAQPTPDATPAAPQTPAASTPPTAEPVEEPIGNVAAVTGIATVIRNKNSISLKVRDDIYLNDTVQTASSSSLSITFNDSTTFNLSASAKITIDNYVYEDGGKQNAAIFDVGKGTVAFVAAAVAKTGDMTITTPTATLGIRGTTGVVEVPESTSAGAVAANNVNIKLYPDADGRVGRIEVNDRTSGGRLGFLTQASSGFAIRPGTGGMRFAAVPITIPQQQIARDQGFVRQVHLAQTTGRQIVTEQRDFRRANPGVLNPNRPQRQGQPGQPPQQRPNAVPAQPQQQQRPNGQPGQNRPGQPTPPGTPNRQGTQPPQRQGGAAQPGAPRAGQGQTPGTPRAGQGQQQGTGQPAGIPPRGGQTTQPGGPPQTQLPRNGQTLPQQGGTTPAQPSVTPTPTPRTGLQPGQPGAPAALPPQQGGVQRVPGLQQRLPGVQRPVAAPSKPAPAPKEKKERR